MDSSTSIAVDAFKYGAVPDISIFFLTHFHSDHYGGLSQTWTHGQIYCSSVTASLVKQQLRVNPQYIIQLPLNQRTLISNFYVTLIDANHCPGSVLFLFECGNLRVLHTGDFRAAPAHILHPSIFSKPLDAIYLDTTYLNPKYSFPHQADVVSSCAEITHSLSRDSSFAYKLLNQSRSVISSVADPLSSQRLLIIVGTYSIGKERMALGIARRLNTRIFASANKRRIYSCLEDPEFAALLTDKPNEAQVHLVSLQEIKPETLSSYLSHYKCEFGRILGFRPTGWTYRPPKTRSIQGSTVDLIIKSWTSEFSVSDLKPARGSTPQVMYFDIPYSEHSSFRDLTCFCTSLDVHRIIPTVNVGTQSSRDNMKAWFDKWAAYRKHVGLLQITREQDRW
ncbi:beta-lactamase-like protein [Dipodascopsis uninucleata]